MRYKTTNIEYYDIQYGADRSLNRTSQNVLPKRDCHCTKKSGLSKVYLSPATCNDVFFHETLELDHNSHTSLDGVATRA